MANIASQLSINAQAEPVVQTAIKKPWKTVKTNISAVDASPGRLTSATLLGSTYDGRRTLSSLGKFISIRAFYDVNTTTVSASPVVSVVGIDKDNNIHRLLNNSGTVTTTLTATPATDLRDGDNKFTNESAACVYDLKGHDKYVVIIETALAVSNGSASLSGIQVKEF